MYEEKEKEQFSLGVIYHRYTLSERLSKAI